MGRGPSYPYVGLEEGIGLTRKMYDFAKRAAAPTDSVITEAWKWSTTSSGAQKVLGALRSFGLIEDAPGSNGKSVKITPRAVRILLDDDDSLERKEEIRKAALSPKWYEYCWRTWGRDMPASMRSNLMIEHGFVESTISEFLKNYRKTIAFAGFLDEKIFSKAEDSDEERQDSFKIGEYVQWESQGTLRMPVARKLTHFSDDGKFAFVEGESTGIPTDQLIVPDEIPEPPPVFPGSSPAVKVLPASQGGAIMLQETFSLPDGRSVNIQWPAAFTPEAFEDFSDWLNIVKRKIGRTVKNAEGTEDAKDSAS